MVPAIIYHCNAVPVLGHLVLYNEHNCDYILFIVYSSAVEWTHRTVCTMAECIVTPVSWFEHSHIFAIITVTNSEKEESTNNELGYLTCFDDLCCFKADVTSYILPPYF